MGSFNSRYGANVPPMSIYSCCQNYGKFTPKEQLKYDVIPQSDWTCPVCTIYHEGIQPFQICSLCYARVSAAYTIILYVCAFE